MTILVDLDGTILDCSRRMYRLFCDLVPDTQISLEAYWAEKRLPRSHREILESEGRSDNEIHWFARDWMTLIECDEYLALDELFPFAEEALDLLAERHNIILLTSRQRREGVLAQLEQFKITHHFSVVIVTGGEIQKFDAARDLRASLVPGDVLVGDTESDVAAARKLGIRSAAVSSGCRRASFLKSLDPDFLCPDILNFASQQLLVSQSIPSPDGGNA